MKNRLYFLAFSFLQAFLVSWNFRVIAARNIPGVIASDILFYAFNFSLVKHIAKANTRWEMAMYILGGCSGSILAVIFT